jgi:DNA-binding transcriptional LysR family regulator
MNISVVKASQTASEPRSGAADVDILQLRYFVSAAKHLNFHRAAETMGVRRPTLSRQVRRLEDGIGLSLFERHRHGVRLTAGGRDFLVRARRTLYELDNALSLAARAGDAKLGHLSLGILAPLISGPLRDFLAEHHRKYPEVELRLQEGGDAELIAAVHERRIDVVIGFMELETAGIMSMALWHEPVYVALPDTHALGRRPSLAWKDLEGEIVLIRSWEARPTVYEYLIGRLPIHTPIVQHMISRETLLGLVGAGFGVTVVSKAATGAAYPGVVFRPVKEANATITLTAAWLASADNPAQRKFLAVLRDHAKRVGAETVRG